MAELIPEISDLYRLTFEPKFPAKLTSLVQRLTTYQVVDECKHYVVDTPTPAPTPSLQRSDTIIYSVGTPIEPFEKAISSLSDPDPNLLPSEEDTRILDYLRLQPSIFRDIINDFEVSVGLLGYTLHGLTTIMTKDITIKLNFNYGKLHSRYPHDGITVTTHGDQALVGQYTNGVMNITLYSWEIIHNYTPTNPEQYAPMYRAVVNRMYADGFLSDDPPESNDQVEVQVLRDLEYRIDFRDGRNTLYVNLATEDLSIDFY